MKPQSNSRDSQYLDQNPELQETLKAWLLSLNLVPWHVDCGDGELEELECRSRDGFSRASHNFGGYDRAYMTDIRSCMGDWGGPDVRGIEESQEYARKESIRWFKDQAFLGLEDLTDDKIDYGSLYELGRGDLAEKLSEVESEFMTEAVRWGVRAMYEGQDSNGIHTLALYCSGTCSEYYSAFGKDCTDFATFELRFKSVSGLKRQLARIKSKVEGAFK